MGIRVNIRISHVLDEYPPQTIDVKNVFYLFFILVTFFKLTFFYFSKLWQSSERQAA